jgi:hypothetical protein
MYQGTDCIYFFTIEMGSKYDLSAPGSVCTFQMLLI